MAFISFQQKVAEFAKGFRIHTASPIREERAQYSREFGRLPNLEPNVLMTRKPTSLMCPKSMKPACVSSAAGR
jgi:hypothetical protein